MNKTLFTLIIFLFANTASAAIPGGAIWEMNRNATASNVNGALFDGDNANFATDGTVDTNTGNTSAPVFSSASYNFVAGDVGAYLYIKSGTDAYKRCYYPISSVASNKATLDASVGRVSCQLGRNFYMATTTGIATVGTPSSLTWGVNYARGTAAINATTNDLASSNGTTAPCTVTSATRTFGVNDLGNGIRVTSGTNWTANWYSINSVSGGAATLDKACGTVASISSGVWREGGAASMNSTLDDDIFEIMTAGNEVMVKYDTATIALGEAVSIAATGGTQNPIRVNGYGYYWGDNTQSSSTRPTINTAANTFTYTTNWENNYINYIGSAASTLSVGGNNKFKYGNVVNTSTTADRSALLLGNGIVDVSIIGMEMVAFRGYGFSAAQGNNTGLFMNGSYIHDSNWGIRFGNGAGQGTYLNTVIANNASGCAYNLTAGTTANNSFIGITCIGAVTPRGVGFSLLTGTTDVRVQNSILYGLSTAASSTDSNSILDFENNDFFNNTNDRFNVATGTNEFNVNPNFTSLTEVSGTGATSVTNVLTVTGSDLSKVVANRDFLYIVSGTGTGLTASTNYLITAVDDGADTLTLSSNITSSGNGSSIVWNINLKRDLSVGTNLKALGFPSKFYASSTSVNVGTSYVDIGALQTQEAGTGGGGGSQFFIQGNGFTN